MLSEAEWRLISWLVRVAQQAVPANHPAAEHIPAVLHRIDATSGCSLTRTAEHGDAGELLQNNTIGTREAAVLMGCTQRAVQQRITRGTMRAHRIGRTWRIDPEDL